MEAQYLRSGEELRGVDSIEVVLQDPLRARVDITRRFGASSVVQSVSLDAGSRTVDFEALVDWQEREKIMKVGFPLDVRA